MARGQHAGFAAARARQNEGGLRRPGYGGKLFGVQALQQIGGGLVEKHGKRSSEKWEYGILMETAKVSEKMFQTTFLFIASHPFTIIRLNPNQINP